MPQILGRGLVALPREDIIVATKVGRYGADKFDFSAERVTKSVHESLERLQLSYIDLIQTHDIEFGDLDQVCLHIYLLTAYIVLKHWAYRNFDIVIIT